MTEPKIQPPRLPESLLGRRRRPGDHPQRPRRRRSTAIKVGLVGCGGRGSGAVENLCEAVGDDKGVKINALGRRLPRQPRQRPNRIMASNGKIAPHWDVTDDKLLHRVRRLPEADRLRRRPRHPGHAARVPADDARGRRQGRQEPLHREARRRRRTRHPPGARRRRRSPRRRGLPSSPAPSAATRRATSRA